MVLVCAARRWQGRGTSKHHGYSCWTPCLPPPKKPKGPLGEETSQLGGEIEDSEPEDSNHCFESKDLHHCAVQLCEAEHADGEWPTGIRLPYEDIWTCPAWIWSRKFWWSSWPWNVFLVVHQLPSSSPSMCERSGAAKWLRHFARSLRRLGLKMICCFLTLDAAKHMT